MRFFRWLRSPDGRPYAALVAWVMTAVNLWWCTLDVRRRYDVVVEAQAFRMQCESSGGFYGAVGKATARCLLAPEQAEARAGGTR